MFIISFALLIGYPVTGALLHPQRYLWSHAVIFGGVCLFCYYTFEPLRIMIKGCDYFRNWLSYTSTIFGQ